MQVAVRELKNRLSHYLAQAQSGTDIVVTSHKKIIANIQGIPQVGDPVVQRLLDSGGVSWTGGKPAGGALMPNIPGKTMANTVLEERG